MSRTSITAAFWGSKGAVNIRVGTSEIHLISAQSRWNRSNLAGETASAWQSKHDPGPQ